MLLVKQFYSYIILFISKAKCARYWPSVGMSAEFGNYILDNMLEHNKDSYVVRELRMYPKDEDNEPPRMIYHYHFTKWPDHGAPDDAESVLDLLDDIYAQHLRCNRLGPLLFHCRYENTHSSCHERCLYCVTLCMYEYRV